MLISTVTYTTVEKQAGRKAATMAIKLFVRFTWYTVTVEYSEVERNADGICFSSRQMKITVMPEAFQRHSRKTEICFSVNQTDFPSVLQSISTRHHNGNVA